MQKQHTAAQPSSQHQGDVGRHLLPRQLLAGSPPSPQWGDACGGGTEPEKHVPCTWRWISACRGAGDEGSMPSEITLRPGMRCCSGDGCFMHTKIRKALHSVLHTGPSWAEKEGPDATLIYASAVGKASIRQAWRWKARGGFPPWGCPPTPLGALPCGDTSEAKRHHCHHMPALPAALMGGKELSEHLVSGQG